MASKAKSQRQQNPVAKMHTPNLERYYRFRLPEIQPGAFEFEVSLLRSGLPPLLLRTVESLSWDDERSVLTGSLTVHRPVPGDPTSLPIEKGQLVRCQVKWSGRKYQLWTMRCEAPQTQVDQNTVTVTLQDDMARLKAGSEDWIFRKTKQRPHGYTAAEVTMEVARRRGMKVKQPLPKCHQRFSLVKRNQSAFQVLVAAWAQERRASGIPLLMRMVNGELRVSTLRRNPILYVLSKQIQTALLTDRNKGATPVTILEGRAKLGKAKNAKQVKFTATDRRAVRLLGNVRQQKDYGTVSSYGELRRNVRRDLAKALKPQPLATVEHQGIPFILRGDAARINMPAEGFGGEQSFVWCARANHTVQGGVYATDFDFVHRDLYLATIQAAQKAKAKASGTGSGSSSGAASATGGQGTRWLVPASAESDPPGAQAACGPLPADRRGYSVLSQSGTSSDAATAGQALSPGSVWPCGATLIITNPQNNKSVAAKHVDNGAGSDAILPVVGLYPQTVADLGLGSGGAFQVVIEAGTGSPTPHPVRGHPV